MKSILKVSRKFMVLAAMLFALGFATFADFGTKQCGAAPCCSECETIYQSCIDSGGTPLECNQQANRCWRWCDFDC